MKTFLPNPKKIAFLFFIANLFFVSSTFGQTTIQTNKSDYYPGETVVITGTGWLPGEIVDITIEYSTVTVGVLNLNAVADMEGNIFNNQFVIQPQHLGELFNMSAYGLTSSEYAYAIFTDATTVTPAANGTNISADKAANSTSPSGGTYTTLGNITLQEAVNSKGDFANSGTLILTAPTGWKFNPSVGTVTFAASANITATSISVAASTITVTITLSATNKQDTITISGIQVKADDGAIIPNSGNIYRTAANPGTATLSGVTNDSTNFGSLSQVVGAAKKLAFTTQPASANVGTVFSQQPVIKTQDQFGASSTTGLSANQNVVMSLSTGTGTLSGTTSINIGSNGGNGTATYTNLKIDYNGSKQLTAALTGFTSAVSNSFTVNGTATTTTLTSGTNPTCFNGSTTLTATVSTSSATGTVQFFDGATSLGSTTVTSGVATLAVSTLTAGSHSLTAVYSGDNIYTTSTSSAVSQTVNSLPTFTVCPTNQTANTASGTCSAVVNYTATASGTPAPTVTYQFAGATTVAAGTAGTGTGSTFNKGVTTVTITANNGCSPNATCSFTVTVNDTTAPVTPTLANVTGQCSATATTASTTDACVGIITGTTADALSYSTQGTHVIHWTFSDGNGNSTTANQNVIVTQPAQPTLACYQTATLNTNTCQWDVTGTQPAQPTLACYQNATFNTNTCQWDVTGTQPAQPTLACYQTATFNTTTCDWDVTGTQPATPSVSIATTSTTICAGTLVTFTATPINGGTSPGYEWKVNGGNVGINSATFNTASLSKNDLVTVVMTSDIACTSPVTSNTLTASLCSSNQAISLDYGSKVSDLVASTTGTNIKVYLSKSTTAVLNPNTSLKAQTYYVTKTINGVEQIKTPVDVTLRSKAVAGNINGDTKAICYGEGKILTLNGNIGSIQWQAASSNQAKSYRNIDGEINPVLNTGSLTKTTYFRAIITNGKYSSVNTSAFKTEVKERPIAGTISEGNIVICPEKNKTMLNLKGYDGTIQWQSSLTSDFSSFSTLQNGAATCLVSNLPASTTTYFRAVVTKNAASCAQTISPSMTITVKRAVNPGTISGDNIVHYKHKANLILSGQDAGSTLQWKRSVRIDDWNFKNCQADPSTNELFVSGDLTVTSLYFKVSVTNNGCTSDTKPFLVKVIQRDGSISRSAVDTEEVQADSFKAIAYPNPSNDIFTLNVNSSSQESIKIKVYDMMGKLVEQRESSSSEISSLRLGENYPAGIYNIILNQDSETSSLRVIKQ